MPYEDPTGLLSPDPAVIHQIIFPAHVGASLAFLGLALAVLIVAAVVDLVQCFER